jgi:hypothetical protein
MARRRNYGKFTTRRKAALRKAQLASARKRSRMGGRKRSGGGITISNRTAAGVGVLAAVGAAYYIGKQTTSHKNTPGGSDGSKPMGTDKKKTAKKAVDKMVDVERNVTYIDPAAPTSRLGQRGKTPAQQTGGLIDVPKSGGGGSTASATAQKAQKSKSKTAAASIPLAPLIDVPKTGGNSQYRARSMTDFLADPSPQLHDQILGWKLYNPQYQQAVLDKAAQHGFLVSVWAKESGRGGVLYKPNTKQMKAARTRSKKAGG